MKNCLIGLRFSFLLVTADSGRRSSGGDVYWSCVCDCGAKIEATGSNLRGGRQRSCGCQRVALYQQARAAKRPPHCTVPNCEKPVRYLGICYMHYTRQRNYGDVNYITPEETRRANNRQAQLARVTDVKPSTYRKLFGRHEHRAVAEASIGRLLAPGEHVHHIDGDRHNNAPDNLQVMTAEEHLALHARERKHAA